MLEPRYYALSLVVGLESEGKCDEGELMMYLALGKVAGLTARRKCLDLLA
jgi:hypothetical protein